MVSIQQSLRFQIGDQLAQSVVQSFRQGGQLVIGVDVRVHVPAAQRDLDISGSLIRGQRLLRDQAGVAESRIAVQQPNPPL